MVRLGVLFFILCQLLGVAWAATYEFDRPHGKINGLNYQRYDVFAKDGTRLTLVRILPEDNVLKEANPPKLVLPPGIIENAHSWVMPVGVAREFFDVYVPLARTAGHGELISDVGPVVSLPKVLLEDYPAHFQKVIELGEQRQRAILGEVAEPLYIHAMGHSMGGDGILALSQEIGKYITAATTLGAPGDFFDSSEALRFVAKLAIPIMKRMERSGKAYLEPHKILFQGLKSSRDNGWFLKRMVATAVDLTTVEIMRAVLNAFLLSREFQSTKAGREFIRRGLSRIPVGVVRSYAELLVEKKTIPWVRPGNLNFPTQIVAAEKDYLATMESTRRIYEKIPRDLPARLVIVGGGSLHVDLAAADLWKPEVLENLLDFHKRPQHYKYFPRNGYSHINPKDGKCEFHFNE